MKATREATILATAIALITLAASPASAKETGGVVMADQVTVEGQTLLLNGMGKREATALNIDVYVAGLYLPQRASDPNAILGADEVKHLRLVFVRKVDRGDMVEAFTTGFRKNVAAEHLPALQGRIEMLLGWMEGMSRGDTIAFTYVPGTGTIVEVNRQRKGVIEGADFGRALFSIWLGERPPNAKLKTGLLGRS